MFLSSTLLILQGTQSRIVEGALVGAVFMLASTITKTQIKALGGTPTAAALAGGLVGGIAQGQLLLRCSCLSLLIPVLIYSSLTCILFSSTAIVMTPAGMIFTSLNCNNGKKGYENENLVSITRRIVKENGISGMYYGFRPMYVLLMYMSSFQVSIVRHQ